MSEWDCKAARHQRGTLLIFEHLNELLLCTVTAWAVLEKNEKTACFSHYVVLKSSTESHLEKTERSVYVDIIRKLRTLHN